MVLFLHGCHNLYFRRNPVSDDIFFDYFAETMSPMYSLIILENHRRNLFHRCHYFLYYQHDAFIQTLGTWFGLRLTTLDALHRFREVLQGDLL